MNRYLPIILFFTSLNCISQDIQFSQFYAVPVYQNPAFAGSSYMHRFTLHQRLQWTNIDARFSSSLVGWDGHFDKIRGGVGLYATHDVQGSGKILTDELAGQYAYEVPLSSKFVLRAGAQMAVALRTIDYSQFRYAQDYTDYGFQGNTYNQTGNNNFWYGDISSGVVLFSDKIWLGIASHHMNEPKQTFYANDNNRLPMKLSFTGGYKYILDKTTTYANVSEKTIEYNIIPTFQYKMQGKSDQLDLGLYSQLNMLLVGGWYRGIEIKRYEGIQNNESAVFLVGMKYRNVSAAYSYDLTISRLSRSKSGGSHEINLTFYLIKTRNTKRSMKRLPCPDYFD